MPNETKHCLNCGRVFMTRFKSTFCSTLCRNSAYVHSSQITDSEALTRFAYVALFRAYAEGEPWLPSKFYNLARLDKYGHVEFKGALVRLSHKGLVYWAKELKKYYAQKSESCKSYTGVFIEKILRGEL